MAGLRRCLLATFVPFSANTPAGPSVAFAGRVVYAGMHGQAKDVCGLDTAP